MFYYGQKVVCINDTFSEIIKLTNVELPVKGQIYTISDIREGMGVMLSEVRSETLLRNWLPFKLYFKFERFRPIVEDKKTTDISIFNKILDEVNQKEDA